MKDLIIAAIFFVSGAIFMASLEPLGWWSVFILPMLFLVVYLVVFWGWQSKDL